MRDFGRYSSSQSAASQRIVVFGVVLPLVVQSAQPSYFLTQAHIHVCVCKIKKEKRREPFKISSDPTLPTHYSRRILFPNIPQSIHKFLLFLQQQWWCSEYVCFCISLFSSDDVMPLTVLLLFFYAGQLGSPHTYTIAICSVHYERMGFHIFHYSAPSSSSSIWLSTFCILVFFHSFIICTATFTARNA